MSAIEITILSNGQAIDKSFGVVSVDIVKEVNRVPSAEIILIDGDAAKQEFAISNTAAFVPGTSVEIKLRQEDQTQAASLFKGVVVRHAVEVSAARSVLRVELKDQAIKLTAIRQSAVYTDQTDDQIIKSIISASDLKPGSIPASSITHKQLVQYYCSAWDFILTRAEVLGRLLVAEDGEISLPEIKISGSAKHTYEYGIDAIYGFNLEIDGGSQITAAESVGWDVKQQAITKATQSKSFNVPLGNLLGGGIARDIAGDQPYVLRSLVTLDPKELSAWSDATVVLRRLAFVRGRISIDGAGDVKRMDVIEIKGVGDRFNGKTLVTGVRHRIDSNGWQTDVQFGIPPNRYAERTDIVDAPAAGLLPGVTGLQIGIVSGFEADPDKELRVQVMLPGIDPNNPMVWARMATPDGGKDRGYFFRPEAGDEVVVGFFNDDPRQAVILGALYSSNTNQPKGLAEPDDKNTEKGIVTRAGTMIKFVDADKPSVIIQTPGANSITIDDDGQQIEIKDQHGNTITMSQDGIVLKSAKDFKIDASGNVEIKGAKVDVK